jgi:hypothetical protein
MRKLPKKTTRKQPQIFKYYQDVDVLLPHVKSLEEISEIEAVSRRRKIIN